MVPNVGPSTEDLLGMLEAPVFDLDLLLNATLTQLTGEAQTIALALHQCLLPPEREHRLVSHVASTTL